MTKGAALQQFFGQFMTAYPSNAVPKDAVLPYLTYDAVFDAWGGGAVSLTMSTSECLAICLISEACIRARLCSAYLVLSCFFPG